jgi:hypothetical protein
MLFGDFLGQIVLHRSILGGWCQNVIGVIGKHIHIIVSNFTSRFNGDFWGQIHSKRSIYYRTILIPLSVRMAKIGLQKWKILA